MDHLGPAILSFAIGFGLALVELISSNYPRSFFVLGKSAALYIYSLIYGVISLVVMLGISALSAQGTIKLEGLGLSNLWIQAAAIGLTVRAFLHIRLVSVTVGSQSFPIGVETVVQIFEPWLLRTIQLDHFNALRAFIEARTQKYNDLADVKIRATGNVPKGLPEQERKAFIADIEKASSTPEIMELYLSFMGRGSFDRVFPP